MRSRFFILLMLSGAWMGLVRAADGTAPVLPKFKALPAASIREVRLVGEEEMPDTLPLLCDGKAETVAVIKGCSWEKRNEFIFELDTPTDLSGIRCNMTSAGGGEFALYVSENPNQWGEPVRRGDFSWSSHFVSFAPVRGQYVKLTFNTGSQQRESEGPVEKPKFFNLRISEITLYSPEFKPLPEGISGDQNVLVDGLADSRITVQCPAQIRLAVNPEQSIGGISLLLGTDKSVNAGVQVSARDAKSGEMAVVYKGVLQMPAAWSSVDDSVVQSLFFDPVHTDCLVLNFTEAGSADFSLCEMDLLAPPPAKAATERCTVHIEPKRVLNKISPLAFGANIEFWLDDDAALQSDLFARRIKQAGITLLRYPGGTESDRYLWKEHRLYNKKFWPFVDGDFTTDTDEMFAFARKTGTEVILCVNTEYAFYENDWEKGAENAAEWVRYCKDKGYPVKYWTIGNEPFWKFNFTAKEFAKLVRLYATKMKKADPDIVIAVEGEQWLNAVALKDKIIEKARPEAAELSAKREALLIDPKLYEQQMEEMKKKYKNPSPDQWWPVIIKDAGDLIGMVETHLYPRDAKQFAEVPDQLQQLRQYAQEKIGHPVELAVTEWNLFNIGGTGAESKGMEQALQTGEFMGRLLEGGIDIGAFWPLTMRGNWILKAMLVEKYDDPMPSLFGFALCSRNLSGNLIASSSDSKAFYTVASHDDHSGVTTLLIFNRPDENTGEFVDVSVELPEKDFAGATCSQVEMLYATEKQSYSIQRLEPKFEMHDGTLHFTMPRYAMAAVKIVNAKQ